MVSRLVFLSVSTIWTIKYCQKLAIFKFLFFFTLLPALPLFLIVLHNGVKNIHVRKVWFVTRTVF